MQTLKKMQFHQSIYVFFFLDILSVTEKSKYVWRFITTSLYFQK